MSSENIKVYHAAELFHLPARAFNDQLVKGLEKNELSVFSPQRNGFEFTQLIPVLEKNLSVEEIGYAMQTIIYSWDLLSLSKCDVVLARFDEPQDPGVIFEVFVANTLGIPVICYRTDVRSPYGTSSDKYGGMHSFPIKTSQVFIIEESSSSLKRDAETLSNVLIAEVKSIAREEKQPVLPFLQKKLEIAHTLFDGIDDIHSGEGLRLLAKRCKENIENLKNFGPRVIRIRSSN